MGVNFKSLEDFLENVEDVEKINDFIDYIKQTPTEFKEYLEDQ